MACASKGTALASTLALAALLAVLGVLAAGGPSAGAAGPSCATGPVREGDVIRGTPCADTIIVPPSVERVTGGGGNDIIIAAGALAAAPARPGPANRSAGSAARSSKAAPATTSSSASAATTSSAATLETTASMAASATTPSKEAPATTCSRAVSAPTTSTVGRADDYVRGDGTRDHIYDSGGNQPGEVDTISYATGVTPGFGDNPVYPEIDTPNSRTPTASAPEEDTNAASISNLAATHGRKAAATRATRTAAARRSRGGRLRDDIGVALLRLHRRRLRHAEILGGGGADVLDRRRRPRPSSSAGPTATTASAGNRTPAVSRLRKKGR